MAEREVAGGPGSPEHPWRERGRAWLRRAHAWRERLRANVATRTTYRAFVAVVGLVVVIAGAIMVPFPGPGWLVVFLGVAIWASEFHWAHRLLVFGRRHLERWVRWLARQGRIVHALVALGCGLVIVVMFWILFRLTGLPGWCPEPVAELLRRHAGL